MIHDLVIASTLSQELKDHHLFAGSTEQLLLNNHCLSYTHLRDKIKRLNEQTTSPRMNSRS